MHGSTKTPETQSPRRRWEAPVVRTVGTVGDVLRNGEAKITVLVGDPGEPRKNKVQG